MPTYVYRDGRMVDKLTNEPLELDAQAPPVSVPLVRHVGTPRPDAGFREVLKRIKKGNPGSTVNTHD